nr:hypothetical protein REQ54_00429 [Rhizobium sp. Q54]
MKIAMPLAASLVLVTAMAAASLLSWPLVGSDADLAIHFGLDGTPNRYAPAPVALSVIPVAAAVATLIFAFTPRFDPKASASPRLYRSLWLFVLLVLTAGHALVIGYALTKAG